MTAKTTMPKLTGSHPGGTLTFVLLAMVLATGPVVLGGARTWILLWMLTAVWAILFVQAIRLWFRGPALVGRVGDAADLWALLFCAYATGRYLTSEVEYVGRVELLNVYAGAAVFFVCRYGLSRRQHAVWLLILLALVGTGTAFFGFWLQKNMWFLPYGESLHRYYAPRMTGTYLCPNHFGCFLAMGAACAMAIGFFSRYSWVMRVVFLYLAVVMAGGVILSYSRGSWLALAAAGGVMMIFAVRLGVLRWYWPLGMFTAGVVVAAFISQFDPDLMRRVQEVGGYIENGHWTEYVRIQLALDSFQIIRDHFWFGTGPATFAFVDPWYQSASYPTIAVYPHNDYLNVLTDYGVLGGIAAFGFIISVSIRLFRPLGWNPIWQEKVIVSAAAAVWCAMLVHSFLDFNMHIAANALILFALAGMGLRTSATVVREEGLVAENRIARLLAVLILMVVGALTVLTVRVARGYLPLMHAKRLSRIEEPLLADRIVELGEAAAEGDPRQFEAGVFLGDIFRMRAAKDTEFESRVQDAQIAAQWYTMAEQGNPLDDSIIVRHAMAFDLMRRYPEAYFLYQKALGRQKNNGFFWSALGNHYWHRGMIPEALAAYDKAINCAYGREVGAEGAAALREAMKNENVPDSSASGAAVDEYSPPTPSAQSPDMAAPVAPDDNTVKSEMAEPAVPQEFMSRPTVP